jgi:hypothetical protein
MPDGDRFERRLRGKGWRSVYRLGCSGASTNAVADRVMGVVANVFRTESIEGVRKIFAELQEALDVLGNPLFRETLSQRAFRDLSSNIQALVGGEGFPEMSRLSEDAALRTFCELDGAGEGASEEAIAQRFAENLVWGLTERRCLSAVRDGMG